MEVYRKLCKGELHNLYALQNSMGRDSSVGMRFATGWTVRGSNRCGREIFSTCPDRPWGLPSLLYNGYRVIPGGKAAGAWR
jgi:hypothetical protein